MIGEIKECALGERPSWDEYFMLMAVAAATRASCHHVRAGSVIVQDRQVIGTGYNGAPPGVKNCLEIGCRKEKNGIGVDGQLNSGTCIAVHSEVNALAHLTKLMNKGATLYVTIFPCSSCTRILISYGIKRVVFKKNYDGREFEIAKSLFEEAGIEVCRLDLSPERINDILFNHPKVDFDVFSVDEKKRINEKGVRDAYNIIKEKLGEFTNGV